MQGNLCATHAQENTQWGTGGGGGCISAEEVMGGGGSRERDSANAALCVGSRMY